MLLLSLNSVKHHDNETSRAKDKAKDPIFDVTRTIFLRAGSATCGRSLDPGVTDPCQC